MLEPIDVFWTGEKVISDGYSRPHLETVANELGRKPFIWDNHIANDAKLRTNRIFLDLTDAPRLGFEELCGNLCGPEFASKLLADLDELQGGPTNLSPHSHEQLLKRYGPDDPNEFAQELAAWLRGAYAFDPECLTT